MSASEAVILTRDVEAALVPAGTGVVLKQGEKAQVTQSLGGNYTVVVRGNMFRIEEKNGDALGIQITAKPEKSTGEARPADSPSADRRSADAVEQEVWAQLKTCYDPEIPVNIVDLGLVYSCRLAPVEKKNSYRADVKMTLTAPGCGMGPTLAEDVRKKLMSIAEIEEANVELVWEPPWERSMLSEAARLKLGMD
jgi:probable FeS assembly SUF system protein SufT